MTGQFRCSGTVKIVDGVGLWGRLRRKSEVVINRVMVLASIGDGGSGGDLYFRTPSVPQDPVLIPRAPITLRSNAPPSPPAIRVATCSRFSLCRAWLRKVKDSANRLLDHVVPILGSFFLYKGVVLYLGSIRGPDFRELATWFSLGLRLLGRRRI